MIFLGAGASKVFGLKTMQDLTNDVVARLKQAGYGETIGDIVGALRRFGLTPDFENIYTTLDALTNPIEGVKKCGAFAAYLAQMGGFERIIGHPEYAEILSNFRNLIYKECSIAQGVIESKRSVFDKLFKVTRERAATSDWRLFTTKMGSSGMRGAAFDQTIITTNYDMAVELYYRHKHISFADGFRSTEDMCTRELDFGTYTRNREAPWLIKLHGSIWQYRMEGKIIQTTGPPQDLPLQISVGEQMMIYPVGEKPILQEPYFTFYSTFKEQIWNVLIAIGYSFRDDPINTAIVERLSQEGTPTPKLIVVNPDPEDVSRNLGSAAPRLDQRIIRIFQPFTDNDQLFDDIAIALQAKTWSEYQQKSPQRY